MTESEKMLLDALQKQTQRFSDLEQLVGSELKNINTRIENSLKHQNRRLDDLEKLVNDMAESPQQLQNELERLRIEQEKTTEQLSNIITDTNSYLSQSGKG